MHKLDKDSFFIRQASNDATIFEIPPYIEGVNSKGETAIRNCVVLQFEYNPRDNCYLAEVMWADEFEEAQNG